MNSKHPAHFLLALTLAVLVSPALTGAARAEAADAVMPLLPSNPPAERDVSWRRVGPQLTALHELYQQHLASDSVQPFDPRVPFLRVADDMVMIDTAADGDVAQLVAALERLGALDVVTFQRVVSARLPLAAIPKLADVKWLRFARPARAMANAGATTSQGDAAMKTDDARTTFSVDGSGVTVGVLSDTFDCGASTPGDYATDIGTADLPAGIEVLDDDPCGIDEGRGMAQLIHDVAPGADLSFHTAFGGEAVFALGIQELAGCPPGSEPGCTAAVDPAEVIVDDVGYFATPMFQDGIIAQAVDVVYDAGVPYFSSAGNSARASWEGGPFVSSGISPPGYAGGDAHDFDPGAGVDIYQAVVFSPGSTTVSFQWDEPFFSVSGAPGSANDIDICIYLTPGGSLLGCAAAANSGADPVEVFALTVGGPTALHLAIVKYLPAAGPDPGFMKYVAFNSGFSITDPYPTPMAGTSFGQNNAMGAMGVGAAFYFETPDFGTDPALLESFSSAGGTPILFDTSGTSLPMPEVRMRPQIVAPDGTNTTFFGSDITDPGDGSDTDTFPNFFGTSAAAPHAAAAAALMLEAFPGLTPSGVENVLTSSAHDMGPAGFDFDSGYGLIDGNAAVGSVDASTSCDGVADLTLTGTPNSASGTFSATTSISYSDGTFDDITARAPVHAMSDGTKIGDAASFFTCP